MKIQQLDLTILDLVADYHDNGDGGKTVEENCPMLYK